MYVYLNVYLMYIFMYIYMYACMYYAYEQYLCMFFRLSL